MAHNDLEKNSEKYVSACYGSNSVAGIYFHDLRYTTSVVKKFPFVVFPQVTAIYIAFNFNAFYSDLLFRQRPIS